MEKMLVYHQERQSDLPARQQRMINDLLVDSDEKKERFDDEARSQTNEDEQQIRETPSSDGLQKNDGSRKVFCVSISNCKESPLSVQETLKDSQNLNTKENITRLIRNEINKLRLTNQNKVINLTL